MAGSLPRNGGNRSSNRTGATVSRRLRKAGFNVSPSERRHLANGLFVSGLPGMASVLVDFGTPEKNQRVRDEVMGTLASWPQVSRVTEDASRDGALYIRFQYGAA